MATTGMCMLLLAATFIFQETLAASARPRYFEAIVVDAEGRSEGSQEELPGVQDCLLPLIKGRCRGYFPSFYYNPDTERCEKFVYSGCGGNNNRFETMKDCEVICKDAKKLVNEGDDCANRNPVCEPGCFIVNDYRDCSRCECSSKVRAAMCSQPPVRGHCRALLPRWRYDVRTKSCHEFTFGGCDGNGNNFITEDQCMQTCSGV